MTILIAHIKHYTGLSSDTKPTLSEENAGSTFYSHDIQVNYIWTGTAWVPNITTDFVLKVSKGEIPGHTLERKFGKIDDLSSGVATDIWEYGITSGAETYTWSPIDTADIDTISSSNSGDTQETFIKGLDGDGVEVQQFVTLNGQNKVLLDTPLNRINRIFNANSTAYLGKIYVYPDTTISSGVPVDVTTVRGFVSIDEGGTMQPVYTTPAGTRAFNYWIESSVTKGGGAAAIGINIRPRVREYGKVFVTVNEFNLITAGSSNINTQFPVPLVFPARADFRAVATSTASGVGVSFAFGIILIEDGF